MSEPGVIAIDVWSDYVCPFCYLEKPVLERLQKDFGDRVKIRWRAFELRPEPVPTLEPNGEYLRNAWAQAVYPMAQERGMALRLPPVQPRSRRAFETVEFARAHGKFEEVHWALFRAFFEDGQDLSDLEVLRGIVASAGLHAEEWRQALDTKQYLATVLEDEEIAARLGLRGVPAMVIRRNGESPGEGKLLSGAHPYPSVRKAVDSAQGFLLPPMPEGS